MSFCLEQQFSSCGCHQHHVYFRPKLTISQPHILLILLLAFLHQSLEAEPNSISNNGSKVNLKPFQNLSNTEDQSSKNISRISFPIHGRIDHTIGNSTTLRHHFGPRHTIANNSKTHFTSIMSKFHARLIDNDSLRHEDELWLKTNIHTNDARSTPPECPAYTQILGKYLRNHLNRGIHHTPLPSRPTRSRRKTERLKKAVRRVEKRSLSLSNPSVPYHHITNNGVIKALFSVDDLSPSFSTSSHLTRVSMVPALDARNMTTWKNFNNINPVLRQPFRNRRGDKNVIYIHGQFEISGGDCRSNPRAGLYEFKAAQLAIHYINAKRIIPGYRLQMYMNDTQVCKSVTEGSDVAWRGTRAKDRAQNFNIGLVEGVLMGFLAVIILYLPQALATKAAPLTEQCDSGVAVNSFYYSLYRQPTMMMVLGTGSSEVTEKLARVVSRWNIIQVSYGATSPALSDRKNFPLFFRTAAPDVSHNAAILAFVQHFKWDTIATLHEQGDIHALPINKLVTELEQVNVSISFTKGVSERDYKEHLQELKVYHLKMYGAEYVWILQGNLKEAWWISNTTTECTRTQLRKAAMGAIIVSSYYRLDSNETTLSGITVHDLLRKIGFATRVKNSGFVSQSYDAVWAMALALGETQKEYQEAKANISLNDFTYSNHEIAQQVANTLGKLRFIGVSGPISFHNSDRLGITSFHQNQGGRELMLVAQHYPEIDDINFECEECVKITWQGNNNKVPIARRIIRLRIAVLDRGVLICVTSLAVFGVILTLTFLSFNLYYRKLKFIKLSSPNLNNFVLIGCMLVYVAMILLGTDHGSLYNEAHFSGVCAARAFLLSGGFSLAFGCMFIKTYRVYHIFIRSNTGIVKSKLLHDRQLLAMVGVLVLVDCLVITLWVTLDPMERQLRNLTMQVNPSERNVVYLYQREQCYSTHMAKWLGTMYIYKGLLLVVGCYMAWETRHVKIPALNDSQYIGMSVYNVVITSTLVVALANVIPVERYTLTFVLISTLIFVSTTMTLCLLFVPKIHTIMTRFDDEGVVVATPGVKVECKTRRFAIDESRESMYRAEVLNRALKRDLLELEEELARLSEKTGIMPPARNNSEFLQQDEDSDDEDLPPWLAEYKKYPARSHTEDMWYSRHQQEPSSGTCFSVLSAVHPLLMSAINCSSSSEEDKLTSAVQNEERLVSTSGNQKDSSAIRSSLPAITLIDYRQKLSPLAMLDEIRSCASDRALNHLKQAPKPTLTKIANWSLSKLNCSSDHFKHQKSSRIKDLFSKSASRLQNDRNQSNSLPKIPATEGSHQSLFSGHTYSLESEWTTAPLCSSSFATAQEEISSYSNTNNNQMMLTPIQSPADFNVQRDSLTDSTCSNGPFITDNSSSSGEKNEDSKGCSVEAKLIPISDISIVSDVNPTVRTTRASTRDESTTNNHQTPRVSPSDVTYLTDKKDVLIKYNSSEIQQSTDNDFNSPFLQPSLATQPVSSVVEEAVDLHLITDINSNQDNLIDIDEIDYDKGTPTNSKTLIEPSDSSEDISLLDDSCSFASTTEAQHISTSTDNCSNIKLSANVQNSAKDILDSTTSTSSTEEPNDNKSSYKSLNATHSTASLCNHSMVDNNNSTPSSNSLENVRQQMFQLERDLILLDLEKSDAIDL